MNVCMKCMKCGKLILKQAFFWFSCVKQWLILLCAVAILPAVCLCKLQIKLRSFTYDLEVGWVVLKDAEHPAQGQQPCLSLKTAISFWAVGLFICLNVSWWNSPACRPLGFSNDYFSLTGKESCSLELAQSCCVGVSVPEGKFLCLFQL